MHHITTAAATLLASISAFSSAAPTTLEARQGSNTVTFEGAGPNPPSYTISPRFDGRNVTINNPLSVSHIILSADRGVCRFAGIDGSFVTIVGSGSADVGPPQVQTSLKCSTLGGGP